MVVAIVSISQAAESTGLIPLTELDPNTYKGFAGGLYPGGLNDLPAGHLLLGNVRAGQIVPRDADGNADPNGWIVMTCIGMSNTCHEFGAYERLADTDLHRNGRLVIINGAQGGQAAEDIDDAAVPYWSIIDDRLAGNNLSADQVQVAWIKQANRRPEDNFPIHAEGLAANLRSIIGIMQDRFANLKMVYFSSRIYAGYAGGLLNPEPQSYESGFSVKWLIADQIGGDADLNNDPDRGPVTAPWLGWGPYMWADGLSPRADGLIWEPGDFQGDGTHPSESGEWKVADLLENFFTSAATTQWYKAQTGSHLEYIEAEADTYVSKSDPNANFGSAATLNIVGGDTVDYMRFDVSGVSGRILRAKLSMRVLKAVPPARLYTVADSSWDEGTITWNNAPAMSGGFFITTGRVSRDGSISADVTEQVNADGDGVITFAAKAGGGNGTYHSIQGGQAPRLVLTLAGVPGDIDGDGQTDIDDVKIMAGQWLHEPGMPSADIAPPDSPDGAVNGLDLSFLAEYWVGD